MIRAMSMDWFSLSLIALFGFGLQSFLYKVAAENGYNSRVIVFWFAVCSCLPLWIYALFVEGNFSPSPWVVWLASLDACVYFVSSLTRLEALRFIPGHLVFLLLRMNILLVYGYSFLVLEETLTIRHILAFVLLLFSVFLVFRERASDRKISQNYPLGLTLVAIATIGSAAAHIVTKYAGVSQDHLGYMTMANTLICLFSLTEMYIRSGAISLKCTRGEVFLALAASALNLTAWVAVLFAMTTGELSRVSFTVGMSFLIPIVAAALVHKERISFLRGGAIATAILAIYLLKG